MEFLTSPLSSPTRGPCAACAEEGPLTNAVTKIEPHKTRKDAMRRPITTAVQTHLICAQCARNHPIWGDPEERAAESRNPEVPAAV